MLLREHDIDITAFNETRLSSTIEDQVASVEGSEKGGGVAIYLTEQIPDPL